MPVKLSERMKALAAMVTPGSRVADVGCDHAYIPIALCLAGVIPSAIALDVGEGPLQRAREHIDEYGLDDRIDVRRSDGLKSLGEDEADTILIAGMGGLLMKRILTDRAIPSGVTELILQPQSEVSGVRRCVREMNFCIADEDMVLEDGKFYPMMRARRGDGKAPDDCREKAACREMEDAFGPVLLAKQHPVLYKWLEKEIGVTDNILDHLKGEAAASNDPEKLLSRREELRHQRMLLAAALECYQ